MKDEEVRIKTEEGRARERRMKATLSAVCFNFILHPSHCGGHGMTFPCSGVGEDAGGDGRAGAADCVSVARALRPGVAAREVSSAFGSLRLSLAGAGAASRGRASFLFFERAASSAAGTP